MGTEDSPTVEDTEDSPADAVVEDFPAVVVADEALRVTGETPADVAAGENHADVDAENQAIPAPNPTTSNGSSTTSIHQIFIRNQSSDAYKIDERVIKEIVYSSEHCINPNVKLELTIYYKNTTVKTLLTQ